MQQSWWKKGLGSAIASSLFLGIAPVFGKQAILFGFSPLAVVMLRTCIAFVLILVITVIFNRRYLYIFPVGLLGCVIAGVLNGLGSIFFYSSLQLLDASVGQLLYSFYPLFVAFWLLLDRQPISRLTLFRLALSIPGAYLLLSSGENGVNIYGAGLMLIAAILYGLHLIVNQRVLYEVPAPTVTLYTLLTMSLTVTAAYFIFGQSMPSISTPFWPIIGMALITFLSRLTLFAGLKHLGELQTAMLGLGELLVTVFLAQWWLNERLSSVQWVGAALLIISMLLVGFDRLSPIKRVKSGWLAWLNPPDIRTTDMPWHQ